MSNAEVFFTVAGIIVGGLYFFGTYLYNNYNNGNHHDQPPPRSPGESSRCTICSDILEEPITRLLLCGHGFHKKCLYSYLIKERGLLGNHPCPEQGYACRITDIEVKIILGYRCCVCEKEYNGDRINLPCGHGMHKECLEANIIFQQYEDEARRINYRCPYNLLRCDRTIPFNEARNLVRS